MDGHSDFALSAPKGTYADRMPATCRRRLSPATIPRIDVYGYWYSAGFPPAFPQAYEPFARPRRARRNHHCQTYGIITQPDPSHTAKRSTAIRQPFRQLRRSRDSGFSYQMPVPYEKNSPACSLPAPPAVLEAPALPILGSRLFASRIKIGHLKPPGTRQPSRTPEAISSLAAQ